MKKVEFKNIDLVSVFKLFGGMSFVLGFIIALFGGGLAGLEDQLKTIPFIGTMLTGFLGAIILGAISAVMCGLVAMLHAVLYNIFAMIPAMNLVLIPRPRSSTPASLVNSTALLKRISDSISSESVTRRRIFFLSFLGSSLLRA